MNISEYWSAAAAEKLKMQEAARVEPQRDYGRRKGEGRRGRVLVGGILVDKDDLDLRLFMEAATGAQEAA